VGKRRDPKKYRLTFADGDYEGLHMTLRSVTIRELRDLRADRPDETLQETTERMAQVIADHLVEWDREDEAGNLLPTTLESLLDEEPDFIQLVVAEWTKAIAGVPAPLESGSPSGELSAVESILTEIPSESLAS
jgi:hypothetical protein